MLRRRGASWSDGDVLQGVLFRRRRELEYGRQGYIGAVCGVDIGIRGAGRGRGIREGGGIELDAQLHRGYRGPGGGVPDFDAFLPNTEGELL